MSSRTKRSSDKTPAIHSPSKCHSLLTSLSSISSVSSIPFSYPACRFSHSLVTVAQCRLSAAAVRLIRFGSVGFCCVWTFLPLSTFDLRLDACKTANDCSNFFFSTFWAHHSAATADSTLEEHPKKKVQALQLLPSSSASFSSRLFRRNGEGEKKNQKIGEKPRLIFEAHRQSPP